MNKPDVYVNFNTLQKNDASYTLNNYLKFIKWKPEEKESVLEIGCGPGDVTKEILVPSLPESVQELICVDRSEEMIGFAQENSAHEKIEYMQMDISKDNVAQKLGKNRFDHVFSFYCLNWVQDQRKAYKNIYDVLKPGGDALVLLNAYHPVFEVYHWLAQQEKYQLYLKETQNFISPYFTKRHPRKDLEDILNDLGFIIHACEYKQMDFIFPNESYIKGFFLSVNPFVDLMPPNLREEYLQELVDEFKRKKMKGNIMSYAVLIACMKKPEETVKSSEPKIECDSIASSMKDKLSVVDLR